MSCWGGDASIRDIIDMLGKMTGNMVFVTSDMVPAALVLELVVFGFDEIFELFYSAVELQPLFVHRLTDPVLDDAS